MSRSVDSAAEQTAERVEGVSLGSMWGADRQSIAEAWQRFTDYMRGQPTLTFEAQAKFQAELASIWFGNADADLPDDPRFADPEWRNNPIFRRMRQSYVAWSRALDSWLEKSGLEGIDRQRAQFLLDAAKDIYAPVNTPFTPETIRKAVETGGASIVKGVQNYVQDLQHNHGYPAVADRQAFELGRDVAATPGKVVFRNDLFELIQYQPTTPEVHKKPLLYVFSQVNRFYLGDLTPERSLFKQLVDSGVQVFAMSWKNPQRDDANWSLDTYTEGVIDAVRITRSITRQRDVDLIGLCAGGLVAATAAGVLQRRGNHWINSLSLFVSILDNQLGDSGFNLFVTDQTAAAQKQRVRLQGGMSERDILEMFAMLRLDESVFSFMRSNYFRGEDPLAHPLLFWSMDYTRVPAELQCDLIDLGHKNKLAAKSLVVLGERLDLSESDYPVYVMAGLTDHITPWEACYRSVHLFGGDVEFVLTSQNHTQTISSRPDNRHLRYWRGGDYSNDPQEWLTKSEQTVGNWRDHWVAWLQGHSELKSAPANLGNKTYQPLDDAPGQYVREK
ncbi:MAG: hypothetical protein OXF72_04305 [Gammaproteobacteria bacterium]|nr:hypothetical protein [Gammaproteobacteria bacterium]